MWRRPLRLPQLRVRARGALPHASRRLSTPSSQPQAQGRTIRAAVARKAGLSEKFSVEYLRLRDIRRDEVLVRVAATGICHTDLVVKNLGLSRFPIVLGHEGAGIVDAVGSSISSVKPGDRVLMTFAYCGSCDKCSAGRPSYCPQHGSLNFGGTHSDGTTSHSSSSGEQIYGSFFNQSSFATYAIASESNIVKVPADVRVPLRMLAPLGCGIQTGAGAVLNSLSAKPGTSIAVFGCGAVGLSAIMAARIAGCSTVIAVDVRPERLQLARELGASEVVDGRQFPLTDGRALKERIKSLTPRDRGVSYSIETSGNPRILQVAFEALDVEGICGMIAPGPPGTCVSVDTMHLLGGRALRGIIQGDSNPHVFIPLLISHWQRGAFPFDRMLTFFENGLDDINRAVGESEHGSVIKPVLVLEKS